MRRIAILTPSYDGKVMCEFSITMAVIFQRAAKERPDLELNLNFWMGEALIQKARSILFSDAYDDGFDEVVFIDADQSFNAQAFFDLIDHPVDVVAIPVPRKQDEERYNILPDDPLKHTWDSDLKLLEVEFIGTGMIRLNRKAMDVLWNSSPAFYDGKHRKLICDIQIIDGGMISEDVQICNKLREGGFKVYVDIRHTCDHYGTKKYTGDYKKMYLASMLKQYWDSQT